MRCRILTATIWRNRLPALLTREGLGDETVGPLPIILLIGGRQDHDRYTDLPVVLLDLS